MTRGLAIRILDELFVAMRAEAMAAFERGEFHGQVVWIGGTSRALGIRIPKKFRQDIEIIANNRAWRSTPSPSAVVSNEGRGTVKT